MFVTCDNEMSKWDKWANKLLNCESRDEEEDIEDRGSNFTPPVTLGDDCLVKLRAFAFQQGYFNRNIIVIQN